MIKNKDINLQFKSSIGGHYVINLKSTIPIYCIYYMH